MSTLDVYTIVSETTPKEFVQECRYTVKLARSVAGDSVTTYEMPGVPGDISKAQLSCLSTGTSEYVTWVDDDDMVLPNAFTAVLSRMKDRPLIICAREFQLLANGKLRMTNRRHHLMACHRDLFNQLESPKSSGMFPMEIIQWAEQNDVPIVDELSWVYVYRMWKSEGLKIRSSLSNKIDK